jgi:hypothetical protein
MRHALLVGVVMCLACLVGCENEREKGAREGREAAQKVRGESGEIGGQATKVGVKYYPGKIDNKKSSEWNDGFREGFRKEMDHK